MSPLSEKQKELLFNYSLSLVSDEEGRVAEQLIALNSEAACFYRELEQSLSPLESFEVERCPEYLVKQTVARLCEAASACDYQDSGHVQLGELLAGEQARTVTSRNAFWQNFRRVLATAAVFLIAAAIGGPTVKLARQQYQQTRCQAQMAQIGQGVLSYTADHDNVLPQVEAPKGAAWWRVGDQNQESHSNTRHIWVLVKQNYVDPVNFICPGRKSHQMAKIMPAEIETLRDFPGRDHITFSIRLMCDKSKNERNHPKALMADLNPLFETLPSNANASLNIQLNQKLLMANSNNHKGRGQNVLFCDGAVRFIKGRKVDISNDDIYTLRDVSFYKGVEVPDCQSDNFLVP